MKVGIDARNLIVRQSGIGRYIVETTRHLAELGCDITLYLPEPPDEGFAGIDGVKMRIASSRGALARSLWGQTILPRQVAADRTEVFWGPAHRLPGKLSGHIPKVLTILDLVWVHARQTMRARTWAGERLFMGPAVRAADMIVAISQATARDVRQRYELPEDRVVTVHPGATPLRVGSDDAIRRRNGLTGPYALFVGTLEPRKNLERLIVAYASLPESVRARCRLAIAGGRGWRTKNLSALIEQEGVADCVTLVGFPDEADLGHLYAHARFVAMPSLFEGFGLPIVEANALGVPSLTSNRSSMPEVAGNAGLLVDPYETASIASGFRRLVEDEALHRGLAEAAKTNAARFDWKTSARELAGVFEKAIGQRKGFVSSSRSGRSVGA